MKSRKRQKTRIRNRRPTLTELQLREASESHWKRLQKSEEARSADAKTIYGLREKLKEFENCAVLFRVHRQEWQPSQVYGLALRINSDQFAREYSMMGGGKPSDRVDWAAMMVDRWCSDMHRKMVAHVYEYIQRNSPVRYPVDCSPNTLW